MKKLNNYIIEKLKVNKDIQKIKNLETFENFAEEYDGEFSKGSIIFKENSEFYKKVINILSIPNTPVKYRITRDRICGNSLTNKYRYFVSIPLEKTIINVKCVERSTGKHVSFMAIQVFKSNKEIKLTYGINDPDKSIEETYVNIMLNNIVNGDFK